MTRGRPSSTPPTPAAIFFEACRHQRRPPRTRTEIAASIGKQPSYLTQLLGGKVRSETHANLNTMGILMGMSDTTRREFLALLAAAGVQIIRRQPPQHQRKTNLELYQARYQDLERVLMLGDSDYVKREARTIYRELNPELFPLSDRQRVARIRQQYGNLLIEAREMTSVWFSRTRNIELNIQVWSDLDRYSPDNSSFADERTMLLIRRAIQLREQSDGIVNALGAIPLAQKFSEFRDSNAIFTDATASLHALNDPVIRFVRDLQHNHFHAVIGHEVRWTSEMEQIARRIDSTRPNISEHQYEKLMALFHYFSATGLKRIVWDMRKSKAETKRGQLADQALTHIQNFQKNRQVHDAFRTANFHGGSISAAHADLLLGVVRAEIMIWINPQTAVSAFDALRPQADRIYPALINKIELDRSFALGNPDYINTKGERSR